MSTRAESWLQIRAGERRLVALLAGQMLVPSAGAAIGIASAESLLLSRVGADALPPLYVALGLVTIVTTLGISALLSRIPPVRVYLSLPVAIALLLTAARLLVAADTEWIYSTLWVAVSLFNTLLVLMLWGIAGMVLDTRQAKRLFALLTAAGIVGLALGGLMTDPLVGLLGTENLVLVWGVSLLATFALARVLIREVAGIDDIQTALPRPPRGARIIDDLWAGFQYVRGASLLRLMAVASVLFQALFFLLSFSFSKAIELQYPVEDDLTGFLGIYRGVTTGAALLLSIVVATRFNARFGLIAGLVALAVVDCAGFSVLSVSAPFVAIVAFRFVHEAWQTGVTRTAWFALFSVVPAVRREQTRLFINGVCLQAGVMLVGIVLLLASRLTDTQVLYLIGVVTAGLTLIVVWQARGAYVSALVDALRVGRPNVFGDESNPFGRFRHDTAAAKVAIGALSDPSPTVRRLAVDILGDMAAPQAVASLTAALGDDDAQVRAAALRALASSSASTPKREITTCLSDSEPEVRVEAILALRRLGDTPDDLTALAEPLLDDPVAAVRAAAAVALLATGTHASALTVLKQMAADDDAESRAEAVASFGEWGDRAAFEPTVAALDDPHPVVRRAAAAALACIDDPRRIDPLVEALGDENGLVRESAAASIGVIGFPALDPTMEALTDPRLESGALQALAALPIESQAGKLRAYARNRIETALHYHELWKKCASPSRQDHRLRLLAHSLRHVAERHGTNALWALGMQANREVVVTAIDSLKSADPVQRANAVETLDSIADRDIVQPVLRLWERGVDETPTDGGAPPASALLELLRDEDPWLRACAALAADGVNEPEVKSELARLAQTDPDSTVRETAVAPIGAKPMQTLPTLSLMEKILFLQRVPLFAGLPPAELKQVAAISDEHLFADGEIISEQDAIGDELYIIVSGEVQVVMRGNGDTEVELARRKSGEYVGEMAIITQMPRMARLVATGNVRTLCIRQKQFEGMLRERPETSLAVMRVLCERLRERETTQQTRTPE